MVKALGFSHSITKGKHTSESLLTIHEKVLSKTLASQIHQCMKVITQHNQNDLLQATSD